MSSLRKLPLITSTDFRTFAIRNAIAATLLAAVSACGGSGPDTPVVAPIVNAQPASLTVAAGSAATFSVTATGTGPLAYQWKRNGADIAGATSESYSIAATQLSDTRSKWSVAVRNAVGTVTSTEADLYVTGIGVFAGQPGQPGNVDGAASTARFSPLVGLAIDKAGNLLATETSGTLRKITPAGQVSTMLSNLVGPLGVALDSASNIYIVSGMTVLKLTPDGVSSTFATFPSCSGRGMGLCIPSGIAIDGSNNVFVSIAVAIRKIAPDGTYVLLEGADGGTYQNTGSMSFMPMASDGKTLAYVASLTVRQIDAAGMISVVAGGASGGFADGSGAAAGFGPMAGGAAVDAGGHIYVTDYFHQVVRKVTPAGVVTTVAGSPGQEGVQTGALPGGLFSPSGIVVDAHGDLYVNSGFAILKIQLPPR